MNEFLDKRVKGYVDSNKLLELQNELKSLMDKDFKTKQE